MTEINNHTIFRRNGYLDVVKFVAIFFVLWGHVIAQTTELMNPNTDYIYQFIYTFHMPLFMGLCGFFFSKSLCGFRNNISLFLHQRMVHRLISLIIPTASFGFIKFLLWGGGSLHTYLTITHNIWFLLDLAINTIILTFLLYFCRNKFSYDWKILLFGIPFSAIPIIGYGGLGVSMYLSFIVGFCLSEYFHIKYKKVANYFIPALIIYMLSFCLFNLLPYPTGIFSINFKRIPLQWLLAFDFLRVVLAISGCFMILIFTYRFYNYFLDSRIVEIAKYWGTRTLDIYLLNTIFIEAVGGPAYRKLIDIGIVVKINTYGYFIEVFISLFITIVMLKVIMLADKALCKNEMMKKVLFYRFK